MQYFIIISKRMSSNTRNGSIGIMLPRDQVLLRIRDGTAKVGPKIKKNWHHFVFIELPQVYSVDIYDTETGTIDNIFKSQFTDWTAEDN